MRASPSAQGWFRALPSAPTFVTITMDAAGRYWASFVIGTNPDIFPELEADTGIDLGLNHFAVLADGRKIASPKFLRRTKDVGSSPPDGRRH